MEEKIYITHEFGAYIKKSKTDGKKSLVVLDKNYYQSELEKFSDGEQVTLFVSNRKKKRTERQNRYYWGVYLPLIKTETGEDNLQALHEYFKTMFLTENQIDVFGKSVTLYKSTTKLTTYEFSQFIMSIASETGITEPQTEIFGLIPLKEGIKKIKENDN